MKREKKIFNLLLLRYRKYCRKYQRLILAGRNPHRQRIIEKHIKRLEVRLSQLYYGIKIVASTAAVFALGILYSQKASAQSTPTFESQRYNPFKQSSYNGGYSIPVLVDIDDDGDLDLFSGHADGVFTYWENLGSSSAPVFDAYQVNPFGLTNVATYSHPAFSDLDNDGDLDLLVVQEYADSGLGYFYYYENTGSVSVPDFGSPVTNISGLTSLGSSSAMDLGDLDGDGDDDVLVFDVDNGFTYFENTITETGMEVSFASGVNDPFALINTLTGDHYSLDLMDLDEDGDLDLFFVSESTEGIVYYENIGSVSSPVYTSAVTNPFELYYSFSGMKSFTTGDLDDDGDQDFLLAGEYGNLFYFENKYLYFKEEVVILEDIGSYAMPALVDIDGDGDLDVISGAAEYDNSSFHYFENVGDPTSQNFTTPVTNPFNLVDVSGGYTTPFFVDIDADGDYDMFSGKAQGNFVYFENTGSANAPYFASPISDSPFGLILDEPYTSPSFADLDGDGDFDMFAVSDETEIWYFKNIGTSTLPIFDEPIIMPFSFDLGHFFGPKFIDLDKDGDLDVFSANPNFQENIGTVNEPMFDVSKYQMGFKYFDDYRYTVGVTIGDIDADGDPDILAGIDDGTFLLYEFISPITFGSGDEVSVAENTSDQVLNVEAFDLEGSESDVNMTYFISSGEDQLLFSIDSSTGVITFDAAPDYENPGDADADNVYELTVAASNATFNNGIYWQPISITVIDVNDAPVLSSIGDQTITEGNELTFTTSASDSDLPSNIITYSLDASSLSLGMSIDSSTGVYSWTPSESEDGSYSVTVTVSDGDLSDSETITVTVAEENVAPVLSGIGDQTITEGNELTFTAGASDDYIPGGTLVYSMDAGSLSLGMSIDSSTGIYSWTPSESEDGSYSVTVTVSDGDLSDSENITVTVAEENVAPVLSSIGDQTITEGNELTFTVSATDSDFPVNGLTYSLDSDFENLGMTIDSGTGAFSWTPEESEDGTYTVTITVTDDGEGALSDSETITLTVEEENLAPVLSSIGDQTIIEGEALTFTASASDSDLPANDLTYSLDSDSEDLGMSIRSKSGKFSWTPSELEEESYSATLTVSDGELTDSETITITVTEAEVLYVNNPEIENPLIYPNPASDHFMIKSQQQSELGVYDLNGNLLIRSVTNQEVDISKLKSGLYLVLADAKTVRLVVIK